MTVWTVALVDLGQMDYAQAWALQQQTAEAIRRESAAEVVYLVEHPPVYTIGRAAKGQQKNLLWDADRRSREGIQLYEVDRGGDITYHGPGQLVVYPILDLNRHERRDLHRYLRDLEEVVIRTLADFQIVAERFAPNTGVWVGDEKIAAIGVKASHWITQHGLALNVNPHMEHFSGIIPCGIADHGVTSMARVLGGPPNFSSVRDRLTFHLAEVFGFAWAPTPMMSMARKTKESG
jgi:lipoate-protein ligase B